MQLIVCAAVVLSCFIVYFFVYLLFYYSLYISSLCVFECICLFITTLISSYFSAWPRHSVRLALAIFAWLCSLFFFLLMSWHFLYQEHNKDCCCCCCYYVKITFFYSNTFDLKIVININIIITTSSICQELFWFALRPCCSS